MWAFKIPQRSCDFLLNILNSINTIFYLTSIIYLSWQKRWNQSATICLIDAAFLVLLFARINNFLHTVLVEAISLLRLEWYMAWWKIAKRFRQKVNQIVFTFVRKVQNIYDI